MFWYHLSVDAYQMMFLIFVFTIISAFNICLTSILHPIILPREILEKIPVSRYERQCNDVVFRTCQRAFNERLNISDLTSWTSPETFISEVNRILQQGVDNGLLLLCNARSRLYQCLGALYTSCISRFYFISQGFTQLESASYAEIFKELEFMCNGGLIQSIQSWDCILKNKKSNKTDQLYKACLEEYYRQVAENPSKICDASFGMAMCARTPYFAACGADVSWWECERVRISLDIDSYCPKMTCGHGMLSPLPTTTQRDAILMSDISFIREGKKALLVSLGQNTDERLKRKRRKK